MDRGPLKVLADTHSLVWGLEDASPLSKTARKILIESEVVASVATLWELLLKKGKKDALVEDPLVWWDAYVTKTGLPVLGIHQSHVIAIGRLPDIHQDPFDRILIAQAIVEKIPLVSKDRKLARYGVQILW